MLCGAQRQDYRSPWRVTDAVAWHSRTSTLESVVTAISEDTLSYSFTHIVTPLPSLGPCDIYPLAFALLPSGYSALTTLRGLQEG